MYNDKYDDNAEVLACGTVDADTRFLIDRHPKRRYAKYSRRWLRMIDIKRIIKPIVLKILKEENII